jgi:hypothetical protein
MYGKIFQRMYQGSMVGAGSDVFAVWGYCISNADPESHLVELNPVLLATIIGTPVPAVEAAIRYLTSPDANSHNTEYGGARMVRQTGYSYLVVSHEQYRNMQNNEELRAYYREAQRKHRMSKNVKDMSKTFLTVKDSQRLSIDSASVSASESGEGIHKGKPEALEGKKEEPEREPELEAYAHALHMQCSCNAQALLKDTDCQQMSTNVNKEASKGEIPPESDFRQRLRALYGRRATTPWTPKERKVLATIEASPYALEELSLIEKHYAAMKAGPKDKDYRRRDMQTLLNNWSGAVDRARNWQPPKKPVLL